MDNMIVTLGSCGISAGAEKVIKGLKGKGFTVKGTGCIGLCYLEPTVILKHGSDFILVSHVSDSVEDIVSLVKFYNDGFIDHNIESRVLYKGNRDGLLSEVFKGQKRIVLRNTGWIDPFKIDDYIASGGYASLKKCREGKLTPSAAIQIIKDSGLRGRGGAGFPTATKWEIMASKNAERKFVICNGDEGDPGAFMDRSVMEGDPHSVLEGVQIAAYASGATQAFIYVRAEYPLAVKTIRHAIKEAEDNDLCIVPVEVREGAGAFVCGEETALIASIEGKRGMPRFRPPYPAESGLWGYPTTINNVETLAAVPWIVENVGEYQKIGYEKSRGTKVFALAGRIKRGGLVEVPFGITLNDLIFDVGGGIKEDKECKAIQIGGPSGGCLPVLLFDTKIDYESLKASGAIVGSGGIVVMDSSSCMVDIAKFFLSFIANESCGKCTFCRVGTKRMLEILNRIVEGRGSINDISLLKELAASIQKASLCALGQTAPNPIMTTLKYFEHEYASHIFDKKCETSTCRALRAYNIVENKCVGCLLCHKNCPVSAIEIYNGSDNKKKCRVLQDKCIKCGKCFDVCKFAAVEFF